MRRTVIAIAVPLASCTTIPPSTYPPPAVRTIPDSVAGVWPAVVDVVTQREYPIATLDAASGLVQTDDMRSHESAWWDCGRSGFGGREALVETDGALVIVTVAAIPRDAVQTQLRVRAAPRGAGRREAVCTSRGVFEAELGDDIIARWREIAGAAPVTIAPADPITAPATEPPQPIGQLARLTGCMPDGRAEMLAELHAAPGGAVTGRFNVRGRDGELCRGPEVLLHEVQVVRGVEWFRIEQLETRTVGWLPARFVVSPERTP